MRRYGSLIQINPLERSRRLRATKMMFRRKSNVKSGKVLTGAKFSRKKPI